MLTKIKLFFKQISQALAVNFVLVSLTQIPMQSAIPAMIGQRPATNPNEQFRKRLFNNESAPSDVGSSGQRSDGGSRGCQEVGNEPTGDEKQTLTALVPLNQKQQVWGATISANPTFWFYVPYKSKFSGEFVLYNRENDPVYTSSFMLSGTPGIVKISLPSSVSLEIGQRYEWYFKIYCQQGQPPSSVNGTIERINLPNPSLRSQLEKATLSDRISILAANGIWHDALTTAAEIRKRNPNDTAWSTLLQEIELANISSMPIVECCDPEK
ncbi:DUF928 domain-containing protein [Phormidium nigroviride]